MQEDRQYGGERTTAYEDSFARKVQSCGGSSAFRGSSKSDPFGILDKEAGQDNADPLSSDRGESHDGAGAEEALIGDEFEGTDQN